MTAPVRVAVVGGARTPFAKAGTHLKDYTALQLGTHAVDGPWKSSISIPKSSTSWHSGS